MMKVRKAQAGLLITLMAIAFVAVACSGGDEDETPTPRPVATGTAGVATATSEARATSTARARATSSSVASGTVGTVATAITSGTVGPGSATATSTSGSTPSPALTPFPTITPSPVPTLIPADGIAHAGEDIDARRGNFIGFNGSGSSDPDGDPLTFTWTQVWGPDVTGGVGYFIGPTPGFRIPGQVSTLIFELRVNDGHGDSAPDRVRVNVYEHTGNPGLFVDGNSGSDSTGNGTMENPFASIGYAISRINGPEQDIHVMSLENGTAYEEPNTLSPPVTTSLYGGYGPDWVRDVEGNKTRVNGAQVAVRFGVVDEEAWISGFDITGANASSPGQDTYALIAAAGGVTFHVEDNILRAGNAGNSAAGVDAGTSYGLWLGRVFNVEVLRNEIIAGAGGNGISGAKGADGASATTNGANGSGGTGGSAGKGGITTINGGGGGKGGSGIIPVDGTKGGNGGGSNGGAGGIGDKVGAGRVGDGAGGGGGAGGNGGAGGDGHGSIEQDGSFKPGNGVNGSAGGIGLTGGGGGGAGGGGARGIGGTGGTGGGGSIGIFLHETVSALIENNTVRVGNGGRGGNGGAGGTGGSGTRGGVGAPNVCSILGCDVGQSGEGGEGGGGGSGGIGGQGGGGAGGPSFGIFVGSAQSPAIKNNSITTGNGGNGGTGGAAGLGGPPGGGGGSSGGAGGCCLFLLNTAGTPGSGGDGGWSFTIFDEDVNDGAGPDLEGNELTGGAAGQGQAINGDAGLSGETNF